MERTKFLLAISVSLVVCLGAAFAGEVTRDVVVTGVGKTEDAANRQAYRNAVEQAVGVLVSSDTMIKNDQLIRDKIITHSDGYVVKVVRLGPPRAVGEGLVETKVVATVAITKLRDTLRRENITTAEMDGTSLFAELATKREMVDSLGDIVAKAAAGIVPTVVRSNAGQPRLGDKPGLVIVPVTLRVDEEAYLAFCRKFIGTMEQAGLKIVNGTVKMAMRDREDRLAVSGIYYNLLKIESITDDTPIAMAILENLNADAGQARLKAFALPRDAFEKFTKSLKWHSVKVMILDETGNEIATQVMRLETPKDARENSVPGRFYWWQRPNKYPIIGYGDEKDGVSQRVLYGVITPRLDAIFAQYGSIPYGLDIGSKNGGSVTRDVEFILSENELKKSRTIKCTLFEEE